MVRGLYTAYTGMANEQKRLDIISNNLANSATVGYKEENVTSKSFKDFMITKIRDGSEAYVDREIGAMNPGVKIGETYMNWDQGSLRETDNTYDMAIQGNGFFAIKVVDKNGDSSIKYTRNGQFTITNEGYVVDVDGNRLQGANGDVQVPGRCYRCSNQVKWCGICKWQSRLIPLHLLILRITIILICTVTICITQLTELRQRVQQLPFFRDLRNSQMLM